MIGGKFNLNANARDLFGEDTFKNVNTPKKSESTESKVAEKVRLKSAENATNPVMDEVDDEICPDESYKTKQEYFFSYSATELIIYRCIPLTITKVKSRKWQFFA